MRVLLGCRRDPLWCPISCLGFHVQKHTECVQKKILILLICNEKFHPLDHESESFLPFVELHDKGNSLFSFDFQSNNIYFYLDNPNMAVNHASLQWDWVASKFKQKYSTNIMKGSVNKNTPYIHSMIDLFFDISNVKQSTAWKAFVQWIIAHYIIIFRVNSCYVRWYNRLNLEPKFCCQGTMQTGKEMED